jgi:glycosyltransferase involved in cell wall biosynthesis
MKKAIKISVVIPSFYPAVVYGGPIFSSLHACEELSKLGHEVYVSTTNTNMYNRLDVPKNVWIFKHGFNVKYYDETFIGKFSLSLFLNLKKDIAETDVVHIQAIFNSPTPFALYQARKLKKPILLSPRGVLGDWIMGNGNPLKKCWLKFLIRPFKDVIEWHATSQQEKDEIIKHYPNARVHIIPNGIDSNKIQSKIKPTDRSFYESIAQEKIAGPIVVSMGRIHAKKGFDILIKSFKRLLVNYPGARLFIAGKDEGEKTKLEQLIKGEKMLGTVFFTGPLKNSVKLNFLAHADVFALPSHNENFGNVYLESLACGTPIVASTHTPWKDALKYNCGLWVENTANDFYFAMKTILEKPEVYTKENCYALANKYSWESIGLQFAETFKKMLSPTLKNKL